MNVSDLFVVEFSVSQQAFHKELVSEMLKNNIKNILAKKEVDYVPIAIFKTSDDCDKFIDKVYETFKKSETDLQSDAAIKYFK